MESYYSHIWEQEQWHQNKMVYRGGLSVQNSSSQLAVRTTMGRDQMENVAQTYHCNQFGQKDIMEKLPNNSLE